MHPPLFVEVSPLLTRGLTGIGRFTARLVEALSRVTSLCLFTTMSEREIRLCSGRRGLVGGEVIALASGTVPAADVDLEGWVSGLVQRPRAPLAAGARYESACLYTFLRPAERRFVREVSIVYDFTPLLLPWAHLEETRLHLGSFFAQTVAQSDCVIVPSEATRADARWLCAFPVENMVVASPGPSLCARIHASAAMVPRSSQLILVVSTLEPRKNAALLQEWFHETQVLAPDAEVWWVGPKGWLSNRPIRRLRRRKTKFVGMVSDAQLCELYRRATFTIYPSLYEGFGFPVLDALLHGTPVVCSFNSSLKEFAGPGVFYFDPCDAASLDAACQDVLSASPLSIERNDLRARCSWDGLAATVLSVCAPPASR